MVILQLSSEISALIAKDGIMGATVVALATWAVYQFKNEQRDRKNFRDADEKRANIRDAEIKELRTEIKEINAAQLQFRDGIITDYSERMKTVIDALQRVTVALEKNQEVTQRNAVIIKNIFDHANEKLNLKKP